MTSDRTDWQSDVALRRFIAGAMDPPLQRLLAAALRADPALRARLERLRQTTPLPDTDPWRLPPPGAAARWGLGATLQAGAVMNDSASDYVELRVKVPADALDHVVLLLTRAPEHGHRWSILAPTSEDEVFTAGDLPGDADGTRRVDLSLEGTPPWRFGVVLVPPTVTIPWDQPPETRWSDIQARIARGALTVEAIEYR